MRWMRESFVDILSTIIMTETLPDLDDHPVLREYP